MLCKDVKVVNLTITEDFGDYRGLFRLCGDDKCIDVDLGDLSVLEKLKWIKAEFNLEETEEEIKNLVMEKVMKATTVESRIKEGKDYQEKSKHERIIRALDMS